MTGRGIYTLSTWIKERYFAKGILDRSYPLIIE